MLLGTNDTTNHLNRFDSIDFTMNKDPININTHCYRVGNPTINSIEEQ